MRPITIAFITTTLLSQAGCAFLQDDPCEDITFSSEQQANCAQLQRRIVNAKGNPIKRTELERRYEQDCVNLRYYRDDQTQKRCENQVSVDKWIKEENAEMANDPNHGLETKDVIEPEKNTDTSKNYNQ